MITYRSVPKPVRFVLAGFAHPFLLLIYLPLGVLASFCLLVVEAYRGFK